MCQGLGALSHVWVHFSVSVGPGVGLLLPGSHPVTTVPFPWCRGLGVGTRGSVGRKAFGAWDGLHLPHEYPEGDILYQITDTECCDKP